MSLNFSMLNGIFSLITDFVTGIFAFIPQMMYFVYTCAASAIDFLQYVLRKLAGLDVYYVNGQEQSGDLLLSIVKGVLGINSDTSASYSVLSTTFWSMIIFGVIVLVLSTIIKTIITHYNYNPDESHPAKIIANAIKSLFTIALVPIVTIFGIEISNALLGALDQITAGGTSVTIATVYKNSRSDYKSVFQDGKDSWGNSAYGSYDFFGSVAYTNGTSISGTLFKIGASNANRVRHESFVARENGSGDQWDDLGIFTSSTSDKETRTEEVAYMIDYAFANCLTLRNRKTAHIFAGYESATLISSFSYLHSAVWYLGTINFKTFSKYNVGLVWYYYNLWGFNWFLAIAGLSIALTLIINIVFGLITRLVMALALFLVFPALVGLKPLDGGNAQTQWRQEFVGTVLMTYGAILGMNLAFMILPILQDIRFFDGFGSTVPNLILDMTLIIAALISVKKVIQVLSNIIGAKDAQAEGAETKEAASKAAFAAADKTMKAAKTAVKVAKAVYTAGGSLAVEAAKKIAKKKAIKEAKKKIAKQLQEKLNKKLKEERDKADQQGQGGSGETEQEQQDGTQGQSETADEQAQTEQTQQAEQEGEGSDETEEKEEGTLVDQAGLLRVNLDNGADDKLKEEDFGDEMDNAQAVKKWYEAEVQSREKEIKARPELSDEQKKQEIEKMRERMKDQATERFFMNSDYVGEKAKDEGERKVTERHERRVKKIREVGGRVKKPFAWAGKQIGRFKNSAIGELLASQVSAFGAITGVSTDFNKVLKDAGVLESTNSTIREFGQAIGIPEAHLPKDAKSKAKKEETEGIAESTNLSKVKVYSEAVAKQMVEIKKLAESMKK